MSENDRKFKVEFTLGKVKSWKMSQKKSENFRNIRALLPLPMCCKIKTEELPLKMSPISYQVLCQL